MVMSTCLSERVCESERACQGLQRGVRGQLLLMANINIIPPCKREVLVCLWLCISGCQGQQRSDCMLLHKQHPGNGI